jgi:hypothetical protein
MRLWLTFFFQYQPLLFYFIFKKNMFKIYNCFSGAFSFSSRVTRHPLSKKAVLATYRVLKKLTPILAVALLEVTFLLVEKSAECAGFLSCL